MTKIITIIIIVTITKTIIINNNNLIVGDEDHGAAERPHLGVLGVHLVGGGGGEFVN